ncbi:MAG: (d)CMP kinase [Clostridia bacterium]|nr:(d)CMP kinase [Clostridia bacterium]NCC75149.1 (d)CMP kinase [Clostridia bacterium]
MAYAIALDGPAGAGKSTIARRVAEKLGILYLDTGAMYRAIGVKAVAQGLSPKDEAAVGTLLESTDLDIRFVAGAQEVWLDGVNVSEAIRTPEASRAASDVSTLPVVRRALVDLQRKIASRQSLIMDGRDIGTHVLPDAKHKFFLTASVEERAHRRLLDLQNRGNQTVTLAEVRADIEYRDRQDSERAFAPLRQAEDAVLVDTTNLTIEEVVQTILGLIESR